MSEKDKEAISAAFDDMAMYGRGFTRMTAEGIKHVPYGEVMKPALTADKIAARIADGIALGGGWGEVFDRYVEAHNDRKYLLDVLLKVLDEAKKP